MTPLGSRARTMPGCASWSSKTTAASPSSWPLASGRKASPWTSPTTASMGWSSPRASPTTPPIVDVMLPRLDGLSLVDGAAPGRRRDAGAVPERAPHRRRSRQGAADRRRRLPDQAVRLCRAAGARAGADAARAARRRTDELSIADLTPRSPDPTGRASRCADRAPAARVRAARVAHAARRAGWCRRR